MIKRWWWNLPIGTRSVLLGAHAFYLHPWFVALGWYRLYGLPLDPRLWVCFFVHDLGYWGKPNMDGPEGESHPELGASIVRRLFGERWATFCLLHSRFYARRLGLRYSRLCTADKMAIVVTPSWLYLPFVRATGELAEYMDLSRESKYYESNFDHSTPRLWHKSIKAYILAWVTEHKDADKDDSWIVGNASAIEDVASTTLPGYLEGGYDQNKYIVLKKDGSPINPRARYMVMRYDHDRDPNGIFATLAYAVSVSMDNPELAEGICRELARELQIGYPTFCDVYEPIMLSLKDLSNAWKGIS